MDIVTAGDELEPAFGEIGPVPSWRCSSRSEIRDDGRERRVVRLDVLFPNTRIVAGVEAASDGDNDFLSAQVSFDF